MKKSGVFLWGLLIGAAAGAVAAMLLAPDKGSVTREKLKKKAREFNDEIKDTYRKGKEYAGQFTEDTDEEAAFEAKENNENQ